MLPCKKELKSIEVINCLKCDNDEAFFTFWGKELKQFIVLYIKREDICWVTTALLGNRYGVDRREEDRGS